MAALLPLEPIDPVDQPTETLFDQVIAKHVSKMRAELVSIFACEVASAERECESLRQQLSMLQMGSDSDGVRHDNSAPSTGCIETTDMAGKSTGGSDCNDEEFLEAPAPSAVMHSSHMLMPELGVARLSDCTASRLHAMLERRGWQARLQKVVLHPTFEFISISIVMLNVVILGIETNNLAKRQGGAMDADASFWIELGCCAFFLVEVVLRIVANWRYFFYGPGWVLNILDFILVAMQVFEIWVSFVFMGNNIGEKRSVNFAMWRSLRLARVVRLFRSARVLVMFAEVRSTALAVILSLKPLSGAMIVMLMLCYSFSVIFIELAAEERRMLEAAGTDDDERLYKLNHHFGSLGSAIITLLHCSLTSSASYGFKDVSALFSSWWIHDLLVPAIMILSVLGMLNIITGIFVDSTNRQLRQDQQDILESIVWEAFDKAGVMSKHAITEQEFIGVVESGKCDKLLDVMQLDKRDIRNLWSLICFEADWRHHSALSGKDVNLVQVSVLVTAIVKMSGTPRRIDLLLMLGMLEELTATTDMLMQQCIAAPGQLSLPSVEQLALKNGKETRPVSAEDQPSVCKAREFPSKTLEDAAMVHL